MPPTRELEATATEQPSSLRAFGVLVVLSFQRHWRVKQMGWIAVGLLSLVVAWVLIVTARGAWGLGTRSPQGYKGAPYTQLAAESLPDYRYFKHPYRDPNARQLTVWEVPNPLNPTHDAIQSLILSIPHAALSSETFTHDWALMNFSRWIVLGTFLGFVLPLFTLSYATAAFGTERESRSLVWIMTRPIPRSGIYLAKFLGTLPWCLGFGLGGFVALCLAGGGLGREALAIYWPAAAAGTIAFAALFHLIGAIFHRPVVVGLVYVFFFEMLVAALPGSLKLLSLTFYARCLMYNAASVAGQPAGMLEVTDPVSPQTAWMVLAFTPIALTGLGMWLFSRLEYRDDV